MNMFSIPYGELCTEYYDLDKPKAPEEALEFYLQYAERATGPILEPMCGTGSYLIPMMEKGYEITGFDSSPQMLDVCNKKCQMKGLKPDIHNASFESVSLSNTYALVFIPSGSICLLTTDQQLEQALSFMHKHMQPDGRLVFEVETLAAMREPQGIWRSRWVEKLDGSKLVLNTVSRFDPETSVETVLCRYELWETNQISKIQVEDFHLRLFRQSELEVFLNKAGFTVERCLVPYSLESVDDKTPTILYECTKTKR